MTCLLLNNSSKNFENRTFILDFNPRKQINQSQVSSLTKQLYNSMKLYESNTRSYIPQIFKKL